jgi:hypothetical protein
MMRGCAEAFRFHHLHDDLREAAADVAIERVAGARVRVEMLEDERLVVSHRRIVGALDHARPERDGFFALRFDVADGLLLFRQALPQTSGRDQVAGQVAVERVREPGGIELRERIEPAKAEHLELLGTEERLVRICLGLGNAGIEPAADRSPSRTGDFGGRDLQINGAPVRGHAPFAVH